MSATREVLIDWHGPIERLAKDVNAALGPDTELMVRMVKSTVGSWKIAEGSIGLYPLVLLNAAHLDAETSRGCGWYLQLHCRMRPGEASSYEARCDTDVLAMMKRIGASLRTRCVALGDLDYVLGEYP